jgi:hypothetical protein
MLPWSGSKDETGRKTKERINAMSNEAMEPRDLGFGTDHWTQMDVAVEEQGEIVVLLPLTKKAQTWIEEYRTRERFRAYAKAVVFEPQYVKDHRRVKEGRTQRRWGSVITEWPGICKTN